MIKHNGETWYEAPPLHKRIRHKILWIGGWERANSKGWKFFIGKGKGKRLTDPFPLRFFNRLTFYSWGLNLWTGKDYLVLVWDKRHGKRCYRTPNGTPSSAHTWYWGTPREIMDQTLLYKDQKG